MLGLDPSISILTLVVDFSQYSRPLRARLRPDPYRREGSIHQNEKR
jgi:hypothetical protein